MQSDLVVIGLGYVGLPLALEATRSGLTVTGLDANSSMVADLNMGLSHIDDISDSEVSWMLNEAFTATTDPSCISESSTVVICVPTPLRKDTTPDLGAVESAAAAIGDHLVADTLVVLESTTYPGTTDDIVRPILEARSGLIAGVDFNLAFSPERIDPGNPDFTLRNTPKVVGGFTDACTQRAEIFYRKVVDVVVPTVGTREAEMAKLLENTYRHVNIALMNEMAVFSHDLGIDLWASIEAAKTKPFGFQAFYPGPGVGGHCIPIDPNYLGYAVRNLGYQFRFVELAQEISGRMPNYVATRAQAALNEDRKSVNGSNVLLLGMTYKANISDERETPSRPVASALLEMGANLTYFDPFVDTFEVDGVLLNVANDLDRAVKEADLVILLQSHDCIVDSPSLGSAKRILDTRGILHGDNVERL